MRIKTARRKEKKREENMRIKTARREEKKKR
jgi:hypothetical protein